MNNSNSVQKDRKMINIRKTEKMININNNNNNKETKTTKIEVKKIPQISQNACRYQRDNQNTKPCTENYRLTRTPLKPGDELDIILYKTWE